MALCNEISEKVVQHAVHCIETHGQHVEYLRLLQTLVRAENTYVRKCQDLVMSELTNAGEDVLVFYNEKAAFAKLVEMMRNERERQQPHSQLQYHRQLVRLLSYCTEGKNVYTEIKCHSLLPLDDIVRIVTHPDCLPEVLFDTLLYSTNSILCISASVLKRAEFTVVYNIIYWPVLA